MQGGREEEMKLNTFAASHRNQRSSQNLPIRDCRFEIKQTKKSFNTTRSVSISSVFIKKNEKKKVN